jgi:RecB family exonuclease
LLALLRLPEVQFSPQRTLALLRSPYFDLQELGFEARDADVLENVSRFGQVIAGLDQWEGALEALVARSEPAELEAFGEDLSLPWLPSPAEAARLKQALRSLAGRLEVGIPRALREWLDWLRQLLQDTRFAQEALNPNDLAAVSALATVLSDLDRAEVLAALPELDYSAFLGQLAGALETAWHDPDAQNDGACIQVLTVIEARGLRYRAVAILGLAEGLFPEVERGDPFLNEDLRDDLGLEPRLGREQAGLFYQAVTRADRALLLTRPYLSAQGEPWESSPFWHAAARLITQEPARVRPMGWRPLSEACSLQEVLFWAARRLAAGAGQAPAIPALPGALDRWERVLQAGEVLAARLASRPEGPFEGGLDSLAADLEEAFDHWRRWSPSGLETYAGCPHRFFAERVLGLMERRTPELGFDAAQLGSLLHTILEQTFREAVDPTDEASLLVALEAVASREFETAPERLGFRANVTWDVEKAGLMELLQRNISALAAESRGWTPLALELPFGFADAPPLELDVGGVEVQVRGLIDRLDRDAAGRLRVIDYKTGGSHLGAGDLVDGRRLQLPLYAMAAEHALGLGTAAEGYYWHLRGAKAGGLKLSRFAGPLGEGQAGAAATARKHMARILQEVQAGHFPPRPPAGGCPSYCAAAAWCWRFQPGF